MQPRRVPGASVPGASPLTIAALVFPRVTQLDLTGPAEVFAQLPGAHIEYVWHSLDPVPTSAGFAITPTATFADAAPADVLLVPGGDGAFALLDDAEALAFLRREGQRATWVTSVCTGAFALAQAGLLEGRRATTHWASRRLLARYPGVEVVDDRVAVDGNRVTAGGVTSGIDFALGLIARVAGEETARRIQLQLEYAPRPPFDAGIPARHPADVVESVIAANERRRGPIVDAALAR